MRSPIVLHSHRRFSRNAPRACGTDSAMNAFVPPPSALRDTLGYVSSRVLLHRAAERAECSAVFSSLLPQAFLHSLYHRIDVACRSWANARLLTPASVSGASRRAVVLRLRLTTAGPHGRLRASCAWSLFFPRSVGLGPTASNARGAFTIVPSMLCQDQAMPSISSYSASPFRHIFRKTSLRFQSRKYLWMELALPYSLGNAFHWHPVRSTYTIASNIRRGSMAFRPPPGRRLNRRPLGRFTFGMSGATRSHSASDTVHDLSVLMASSIT
jgi:hypothetical protein